MRIVILSLVFFTFMFFLGAQEKSDDANAVLAPAAAQGKFTKAQIEQLVAPVALYPDNLLAQVLAASTYPADIVAAARWVKKNPSLSQNDIKTELNNKKWDPSVQGLVFFPDLLAKMNDNLDWTKDLGDAFMEQQKDVMDTVQTMRSKVKDAGALKSDNNQKVTTTQEGQIQIESVNPEVVYVNNYIPSDSYGEWNSGISYDYPNVIAAPAWPGGYYGASWALAYRCAWNNGYIANGNNDYFAYHGNYNANNLANSRWAHNETSSANAAPAAEQALKQPNTGNTNITDIQGIETGPQTLRNLPNAGDRPVAATAKNLQNSDRSVQAKDNAFANAQSKGDLERTYSDRGYTSRSKSTSVSNRPSSSVSHSSASRPNAGGVKGGAARSGGGGGARR